MDATVFAGVKRPLEAKILGVTVGLLGAMSLAFLVIFVQSYQQRLIDDHARASVQINTLLTAALENAMLKRDIPGLQDILHRLGEQPGIDGVYVLDRARQIRFSDDPDRFGRAFPAPGTAPLIATEAGGNRITAESVEGASGSQSTVLRSVNAVANKAPCEGCHGPTDVNPVNGYLVIDYRADGIAPSARRAALTLALSGGAVVLLAALALWWALRKLVIVPLDRIGRASLAISSGNLQARTGVRGNDEIGWLGQSLDAMATALAASRDELQRQQAFYQAVIDAVPDGVRVIGPDYRIRLVNRSYCEQQETTPQAVVGTPCHRSSHALDEPCMASLVTCPHDALRAGHAHTLKCRHRHVSPSHGERFVEVYAGRLATGPDGEVGEFFVESIRDLSDQVSWSMEHRLSEIGYLATGVAHEIHNPLSSISLAIRAISVDAAEADGQARIAPYLQIVQDQVERCVEITRRLMTMSQPPSNEPELVDLAEVAREVLSLLAYQAENIGVRCHVEAEPHVRVLAATSDIHMVLLNLVQNAFHAMPDGGKLSISIQRSPAHDRVRLLVQDTGCGIAPENIAKVFWPFWSQRADGVAGTGLGLALCRSLVEKSRGTIGVSSVPGKGSMFRVEFPAADWTGGEH